jgi:hypothetical protein
VDAADIAREQHDVFNLVALVRGNRHHVPCCTSTAVSVAWDSNAIPFHFPPL